MKQNEGQPVSSEANEFAVRLREERLRMEPHQGRFAALIGIPRALQSFRENGERELKADYLAQLAAVGIDISYIVTGERSAGTLSVRESDLVSFCRQLPDEFVEALLTMARIAAAQGAGAPLASGPSPHESITVHDRKIDYRAD